jgi:polar amino acid transport system ATP-binding protein
VTGVSAPTLELRDIEKSFGELRVLKGISLMVRSGGVAVLIGPSGGGKTTLLRCTNFLEVPDRGIVLRDGVPFGAWRDESGRVIKQPRRDIQRGRAGMPMVFQRFNLFQNLTVLENVVVGQRVVLGRTQRDAEDKAKETLERVGLSQKLRSHPATLSGGQQQRVGIARALAMDPDVLLLDEPTSSLDPELIGEVLTIIRQLAEDGITMILATHEMGLARQIASSVHFIDDGVIVEEGTPSEVFDTPAHPRTRDFVAAILR